MTTNTAHSRPFQAAFSLSDLRKDGETADKCECKDDGFRSALSVLNERTLVGGLIAFTLSDGRESLPHLGGTIFFVPSSDHFNVKEYE